MPVLILRNCLSMPIFLSLCACGGGLELVPPSAFVSGGNVETGTGNGLAAADADSDPSDLEGETASIRLARFVTNHETGETELVITDEVLTAGTGYAMIDNASFALTIDGVPFEITDGAGPVGNGQTLRTYVNTSGAHSGTISVFTYVHGDTSGVTGAFDTEAYHAFGFETAPETVADRTGKARFYGTYFGFGQILDADGALQVQEVENNGNLAFLTNFSTGTISGAMAGTIEGPTPRDYEAIIKPTTRVGNGFGSNIVLVCEPGASCSSNSLIGGAFYGPDSNELSGIIGFDETITDAGGTSRYVGAGGFTAAPEVK